MAQNLFLRFAFQGANLNLLTDAQYQVDNMRYVGNERGVARRQLVNKTLKQAASMAYALGEAVVFASGLDIADDGQGLQNLIDYLKRVFIPPYIEADANKFLVVNSTGTGIVFRTIDYATTSVPGIVTLAVANDINVGTDALKAVTPASLQKSKANGLCPLGANVKVPNQFLPSVDDGIPGLVEQASINEVNAATILNKFVSPGTLLKNRVNGVCPLDSAIKVSMANLHTVEANGLATLGADVLVPSTQLPKASLNTVGIIALASEADVAAGTEPTKAITPYTLLKGKANGVVPLNAFGIFNLTYHPDSGVSSGTYARMTVNSTGHITSGDNNLNAAWLTSGVFPIARHPASGVAAGTYSRVSVNTSGHVTGFAYVPNNYGFSLPEYTIALWSGTQTAYNVYVGITNRVAGQGLTVNWPFTYRNGEVNTTIYLYIGSSSGGTNLLVSSRYFERRWNWYSGSYVMSGTVYPSWSGAVYMVVVVAPTDWDSTGGNSILYASSPTMTYQS